MCLIAQLPFFKSAELWSFVSYIRIVNFSFPTIVMVFRIIDMVFEPVDYSFSYYRKIMKRRISYKSLKR